MAALSHPPDQTPVLLRLPLRPSGQLCGLVLNQALMANVCSAVRAQEATAQGRQRLLAQLLVSGYAIAEDPHFEAGHVVRTLDGAPHIEILTPLTAIRPLRFA